MADKDINNLKKELFNLKIMKKSGQLTDTSQFKKVKKQKKIRKILIYFMKNIRVKQKDVHLLK